MPAGAEFCTECGAPLVDAPGVAGSDAEVYPELAKANLLRMRKEFKPAEDICLSILRRFPNNFSANTLLGDIAVERGELEQGVEWYELALDIVPDSAECKQKLEDVSAELMRRQTKTTVETLGIPPKRSPIALYGMVGVVIATFAIAAVLLANRKNETPDDVNKPVVVKPQPKPAPEPKVESTGQYRIDDELGLQVASEAGFEGRAITASVADGEPSIRLIVHAVGEDGEWGVRARLVMAAFRLRSEAPKVELQYHRGSDPKAETNIVVRSSYEKTKASDFDATDEALVIETLFGRRVEIDDKKTPVEEPENKTVTPPIGQGGGEGSSEAGSEKSTEKGDTGG